MSRLGFYLLCGALCGLVVLGQGDVPKTETEIIDVPPKIIPTEEPDTTTQPTTTTPIPTTPPSTTTPSTTPTTTTPIPTTTPSTTTPSTTTSSTTPPTTTTSSTTTTTTPAPPKPTPAPKPTPPAPVPPPSQGTWALERNNKTCIVVQFAAQLNVTYTKLVDNSTTLDHVILNVPANASILDGSCSANNNTQQWMSITWAVGALPANNMTLVFLKNGTNYNLQLLNVTLAAELFPNASSKNPIELSHGAAWQTPLATSYRCGPPTDLNMTAETSSVAGRLTMSQLQEEAFRTSSGKAFSAARDCGSGDVPDAVPIAVGCALGGLVVVVLIAYLVGRRRSAARGYLSM